MKIAVIGFYGHGNLGDELNLRCMLSLLRRQRPSARVTVFSPSLWHSFTEPGYPIVGACANRRELVQRLNTYDLALVGGGGLVYLGANWFWFLAEDLKTPFVFSRVGVDDRVVDPLACKGLGEVLRRAAEVTVRTRGDQDVLRRRLGLGAEVVPEAIWTYAAAPVPLPGVGPKLIISLNTHGAWSAPGIRKAMRELSPPPAQFLLSMQETSIDAYFNVLAANPEGGRVIPDTVGLDAKAGCLAGADLVMTSRLHAALIAVNHGVPALMIRSTPKIRFLAEELGLASWHCEREPSAQLVRQVLAEGPAVRARLSCVVSDFRRRASQDLLP